MKSRIRQARASDLEAVRRLNTLLRTGVRGFYWDSDRYLRSAIARRSCYVAEENREVQAALIVASKLPEGVREQRHLVIETLVVDPRYRGHGIGTELVELAKRLAFDRNRRLYVESFYEYGKPSYYRNIGFELAHYRGRPYHVLYFDPRTIPTFPAMKRIAIGDRLHYLHHLQQAPEVTGDLTFERLLLRDDPSRKVRLSLVNGNAIAVEVTDGATFFYPPLGASQIDQTILQCLEWLADRGARGCFFRVPREMVSALSPQTRSKLRTTKERGSREWRYAIESLCDPAGAATRTVERDLAAFLRKAPVLKWTGAALRRDIASRSDGWNGKALPAVTERAAEPIAVATKASRGVDTVLTYSTSLGLLAAGLYTGAVLHGFTVAGVDGRRAFVHFEEAARERGTRKVLLHLFATELRRRGIQIVNRGTRLGARTPIGVVEKQSLELRTTKSR